MTEHSVDNLVRAILCEIATQTHKKMLPVKLGENIKMRILGWHYDFQRNQPTDSVPPDPVRSP